MTSLSSAEPITLPCGLTFPNRLAKAAMAEGWADKKGLPKDRLVETYGAWADGGWGMVLTGNVQIDVNFLGTAEDNTINENIPYEELLGSWKKWAAVTNRNNTPTIQDHGTECRRGPTWAKYHYQDYPVPLSSAFPEQMTQQDIDGVVQRFANGAKLAYEAGFAGVQLHGAHGYLLAQFLSARTNKRTDKYGGSPKNRARIVVEVIEAIRKVVPKTFCVGIKLNSVDHQSEKELGECIEQLEEICRDGLDFLEISGGTYENPTVRD
ncbi:hypothetical protein NQ176_g9815 [Zarea fungicola]|uniref:Uncharacterized protein n=1 Tax=Zarea fungicola TaxID=93591 RepID=A0ACC1MJE4_9HYPO|nr:hypothetical protein NQ176_g9815 [Lecanicillium fungicola]